MLKPKNTVINKRAISYFFVILAGFVVFIASVILFYNSFIKIEKAANLKKSINDFYTLYNDIEDVCKSVAGEKRITYVTLFEGVNKIYGEENLLCIDYLDDRICREVSCNIQEFTIDYKLDELYKQAFQEGYQKYKIEIIKEGPDLVIINSELYIG